MYSKIRNMGKTIYSEDHIHMVKRLIEARKKVQLSQKEVSKLIGKSQSYISKIESGQRRIDIVQLKELAKVYKKPIDYFLN